MGRALGIALSLWLLAADVQAEPAAEPLDDKLVPAAVLTGVGVASTVIGIVTVANTSSEQCPLLGGDCVTVRDGEPFVIGTGLLAGGIGATAIGASTLYASLAERPYPADSPGLLGTGIVATGLGAAGLVGSAASMVAAGNERRQLVPDSALVMLASGTVLAAGAPMWIAGGRPPDRDGAEPDEDEAEPPRDYRGETVLRSPAMGVTGVGMVVGGVGLGVTSGIAAEQGAGIFFLSIATAGGELLALGIVMTAKGFSRVPTHLAHARTEPAPLDLRLGVGPGGLQLAGSF